MQKPPNQPAMQIKWLAETQCEPKTRKDFRIDQSFNKICDYIIKIKKLLKLVTFAAKNDLVL